MLDIVLPNRSSRSGSSRRDFLRVGGLGALGLPALWRAEAKAARPREAGPGRSSSSTSAAACRTTTASTSSPTPRTRSAASTAPIATSVPGLQIGEMLPRMARIMDKVALVRSGGPQQRPPRDGHQLGAVRPVRLRRSATTRPSAPWSPTRSASAARCRPTSPCRATRRSPGSWAKAPSSAAATSRSRPATRRRLQGAGRSPPSR